MGIEQRASARVPTLHAGVRAPQSAYFDEGEGAWIFSRYADCMAALREPLLWPVTGPGVDRDEVGRLRARGPTLDVLSAGRVSEWMARMAPVAERMIDGLPRQRTVDLLAEFALPWCGEVAFLVLGVAEEDRARVSRLGAEVFAGTGAADGSPAKRATAELEVALANVRVPMGEPTFVATSQTTPRLMASVWLALLEHPAEATRLRADPALWATAVDELLRYAGIVRRIWRQARGTVEIAGVQVHEGQRVKLLLASANRDPEQFAEPERLDVGRRVPAQFALGAGRNSCAGAVLVRAMVTTATRALWERCPEVRLCGQPEWRTGSGYGFPETVPVALSQKFYKL